MLKKINLLFVSVIVAGCGSFGKIYNKELILKFPIIIDLNQKNDSWQFVYTDYYNLSFNLMINDINQINFFDFRLNDEFSLSFRFNEFEGSMKNKNEYLFYKVTIITSPEKVYKIYNNLLDKSNLYVVYNFDNSKHLIDVTHKVRYIFSNVGKIEIQDIREFSKGIYKEK